MRLIAIADTHIKQGSIMEQLPCGLLPLLKNADIVIHAGDFITKAAFDELSGICRLAAVHGNMDEVALKRLLPERVVMNVEDIRIGVIHEAALSVQDITGARYMAKEMDVDVLVFGHIHRPVIEKSDVLLICPGSPTVPRLSAPCAIELIVEHRNISGKVIYLEGRVCSAIESAVSYL